MKEKNKRHIGLGGVKVFDLNGGTGWGRVISVLVVLRVLRDRVRCNGERNEIIAWGGCMNISDVSKQDIKRNENSEQELAQEHVLSSWKSK